MVSLHLEDDYTKTLKFLRYEKFLLFFTRVIRQQTKAMGLIFHSQTSVDNEASLFRQ